LKKNDFIKPQRIPSYVLRQGRMTTSQEEALALLWPRYGLTPAAGEKIDLNALFARQAERVCEIGFGMGQSLIQMAVENPSIDYIGIEVHTPGIGALLLAIDKAKINNIRILRGDAALLLAAHFDEKTWDGFQVFFPDPWPKRRHHKRRLLQLSFLTLLLQQLKPSGFLHIATDWEDYAKETLTILSNMPGFVNAAGVGEFAPRPLTRPLTKFENRGLKRGYHVWDLLFYAV
jgi:tRNA (guanine-N7-)-methyltransferase